MENIKKITCEYWNSRANDFADFRKNEYLSVQRLYWREELASKVSIVKGRKLLDIGCGSGFLSVILADIGFEVYGIDLSSRMIDEAKLFADSKGVSINFEIMDAEKLKFENESFDYVVSRNVMWNLPEPEKAYKEWLRVLKKGGSLITYDAEYSKNYIVERNQKHAAHVNCTEVQLDAISKIYNSLDISRFNRPKWDIDIIAKLGYSCVVDDTISEKIYNDINSPYYISEKMFCIVCNK